MNKTATIYDTHAPKTHALKLSRLGNQLAVWCGAKVVVVAPEVLASAVGNLFGTWDDYQEMTQYIATLEEQVAMCECGACK